MVLSKTPKNALTRRGPCRVFCALAGLAILASQTGCIVERTGSTGPQGVPLKPRLEEADAIQRVPGGADGRGVGAATRSLVGVKALGEIGYDGLTLPLCSPDGRYIVTQVDQAPTWPMILAEPTREAPVVRARQRVYDLSMQPPTWVEPASPGLGGVLLGRSADARGYLVEAPRPDGARWIGRVGWISGEVEWLIQRDVCAAFAIDAPGGGVIFCERPVDGVAFVLVVRSGAGVERRLELPGETLMFPMICARGENGGVVAIDTRGRMELVTFSLNTPSTDAGGDPATIPVTVRHVLAQNAASPSWAYQAVSPVLASVWSSAPNAPAAMAIIAPKTGRPTLLDALRTQGIDLPGPSVSVFITAGEDAGVLLTRAESLERISAGALSGPVARVSGSKILSKPALVRGRVGDSEVVVVGPVRTAVEPRLEVVRLQLSVASGGPEGLGRGAGTSEKE
ncbi:MAG: hypothetical protein ACT4PL_04190 [Phycisphaerales bacterium]